MEKASAKVINQIRCQIFCFPEMSFPLGISNILWQRRNRLKRILKRRRNYVINLFNEMTKTKDRTSDRASVKSKSAILQIGDIVRVKSKEEIQATLDRWGQFKKCSFMEEMWPYCSTTQKILKRVEKFLDERDYLMKKCKGIVILDSVFCEGTKDFGPCDRTCFFFWREEWLERIDK